MPECQILVGCPCSGKSTYREKFLKDNQDYVIVSSDDIIDNLCAKDGITYSQGFKKHIDYATKESKRIFNNAIENKQNIIIDQTNMSVKSRKSKLDALSKDYVKTAVIFIVQNDVLYDRLEKRAKETGKNIPKDVIISMLNNYEKPSKEEGFDNIVEG